MGLGLELAEGVEVGHAPDVVLLQQAGDRVLRGDPPLDEPEPGPEHVAQGAHLVGDHVRSGQEVGPEKMGQHPRVRAVRLHLRGADGLAPLRVGEVEVHVVGDRVPDPVPPRGALDGGGVVAGDLGEVGPERLGPAGHLCGRDDGALGVEGGGGDGALVEVEAGEVGHGRGGGWDLRDGVLIGMILPL